MSKIRRKSPADTINPRACPGIVARVRAFRATFPRRPRESRRDFGGRRCAGRSRKRKPPAPGRGRATFRSKHEQLFRPVPGRGVAGARENPGGISEMCRAARRRGRAGWAGQGAARRTGRACRQRPGLQGRGETVMHPGGSSLGAAQVMAMRRARVRMAANSGGDKAGACRGNVRLREFPRPPPRAGAYSRMADSSRP